MTPKFEGYAASDVIGAYAEELRDKATSMRIAADTLDAAFLRTADARAVQGGAVCIEAQALRAAVRAVLRAASELSDD